MNEPGGERLAEIPAGITLGPLDQIADGEARGFVIQMRTGRFHGFAVRRGDAVIGYRDRCPHMGVPLAQRLDDYLTPDGGLIACAWHGALFRIEDGSCLAGPCGGQRLTPWPLTVANGAIITAAAADASTDR